MHHVRSKLGPERQVARCQTSFFMIETTKVKREFMFWTLSAKLKFLFVAIILMGQQFDLFLKLTARNAEFFAFSVVLQSMDQVAGHDQFIWTKIIEQKREGWFLNLCFFLKSQNLPWVLLGSFEPLWKKELEIHGEKMTGVIIFFSEPAFSPVKNSAKCFESLFCLQQHKVRTKHLFRLYHWCRVCQRA